MAVTFDAVGPSATGQTSSTATLTWTHTAGASATAVIVGCALDSGNDAPYTLTATYGGTAMTPLGLAHANGQTAGYVRMFGLTGISSGAATVTVSCAGGTPSGLEGGSMSFAGATGFGTPVTAQGSGTGAISTLTVTVPSTTSGNQVAVVMVGGNAFTSVTSPGVKAWFAGGTGSGAGGASAGGYNPSTGSAVGTTMNLLAADWMGAVAVEVQAGGGGGPAGPPNLPEPEVPPGLFSPMAFRQHGWAPVPAPQLPPVASVTLTDAGFAADVLGGISPPCISQILGTGQLQYFATPAGNPRLVIGDAAWAWCGNAGRWNGGNWQADFDTYLANRAGQGYTIIYTKPMGTTQSSNLNNNGGTFDNLYPFQGTTPTTGQAGANPSTGLTAAYWARIDYMLNSAAAQGVTIFFNAVGYGDDFISAGPLAGKSSTEFQAYGTALGGRYKNQVNLIWMQADDYFGTNDSLLSAFLTGVRGAGDTHPVSVENMAESTSRQTLDTTPASCAWGASNAQYNFVYTYAPTYRGIEQAYLESSPVLVILGDGYFFPGGSTYANLSRAMRQDCWWALSSGARGAVQGFEAIWQWPSTALADSGTDWWPVNNTAHIRTFVESLPGWHQLIPDTSSVLVTGGRGTHTAAYASGGGGGTYEPAFTDNYVTASRNATGSTAATLAVIYMSQGSTITIDQTKMAAGYTATWVDPVTTATSSATVGSTYNSTAKGNNSRGDPDWVLVLQGPTATPVAFTDSGASSDALAVTQVVAVALTDAGASADALAVSVPVALTDAGVSADALATAQSVAVTLADTDAGADALGVLPRMSDTGTSADALAFTLAAALADTGTSADIFAVTQPAALADTGSSAEGFAPGALLTDAGASADALATLAVIPVPLTDTGTSADALAVLSVIPVPLADTGTSADVLAVTAVVPLADASASVEGFWPGALLADTGTSADTLILAAAVPQADTGTGTDAFWPGTALADTGASADTLPVAQPTALADTGTGTDQVFVPAFADAGASLEVLNNGSGQTNNFTDTGTSTDVLAPGILNAVTLADAGVAADLLFVPAFADTGASADLLPVTQPTPLPDAGTGTDLVAIPGFADIGTSAEAFSSGGASTTALTDAGTSADALFIPAFADAGTSAEAFSGGAFSAPNLPDTGTATDSLFVPGFAETGTSAESFTVTATAPLPDTGQAADALAVPGFADTGTSADALVAGQFNAIPLTQAAASAETLTVAAIGVTLADAGAGTDLLFVPGFAETGASADALAVPVAGIPLADAGISSETLAALAPLPDTGHATDLLVAGPVVPVPLTDTGHGTDICRIQLFVPGILTAATSPAAALTGTTAAPAVLTAATAAGGPSLWLVILRGSQSG